MNNSNERAKLLYSIKEHLSLKDAENQHQSVTINDILKSVQILEDADKTVNNKRNKTNFGTISNQFIKLSSLNTFKKVLKPSFSDMPSYSTKDPQNDLSNESRTGNQASLNYFPLTEKLNTHQLNENNEQREIYTNCELQEINSKKCKQIINPVENVNNHLNRHVGDMQEDMDLEKKKLPKDRCGLNTVSEGTLQSCNNELVHQQISVINHENQSDIFEEGNKQLTQKNMWDTTIIENSEQLRLGTLTTNEEKVWNNDVPSQEKLPQISASTSKENYIIKDKNVEGHALNVSSPFKVEDELYGFTYTQLFNDDLTYFMNNLEEQNSAKPNNLDKCSGPLEVLSRNKEKYINLTQPVPNNDVFCDTSVKQKLLFIQRSEPLDDDITSLLPQVGDKTITKLTSEEATVLDPKRDVFSTASGKKVHIDSKSLDKVRLLFIDDAENSNASVENKKEKLPKNCSEDARTLLFKESNNMYAIASGKSVEEKENESSDKVILPKDYVNDTGDCFVSQKDNSSKKMLEQNDAQLSKITLFSFTTAGGKCVKIDSQNLDKVRLLFNDDLESAVHITADQSKSSLFRQLQKETEAVTFSTDKGKSVEVNSESLDEARLLLNHSPEIMNDVSKNCSLIKNILELKQPHISKTPFAFSTAGGKSVKIDTKSLDKARLLFDDDEKDNSIVKACHSNTNLLKLDKQQIRKETKLFGFSTARGKSVKVESKSLEDVKLLFNDDAKDIEAVTSMIDDTWLADNQDKGCEREFEMKSFSESTPLVFSTAGGKLVEIESKSVDEVKMLFCDELDNIARVKDTALLKNVKFERAQRQDIEQSVLVKADNESCKEFSEVLDSIKTLSKGYREDKLVSTIKSGDVSTINTKRKDSHLSKGTPFMFSTASGNTINVDSKSLEKVRLLFKDEEGNSLESENDDKVIINHSQKMHYKDTEPFVFSSASGKSVMVDRQILDKVNLLRRDDVEKTCDVSSYHTLPTAISFASGKSVKVDPGSLCKVSSFSKTEPIDEANFSLKTNDISTRNNIETHKPDLFKKELPPKPANTIVQSCFHSQEDIADLVAADLEKFSTLPNVKISSKELLANSKPDNEDQLCTVSRTSVNRALFKEMPAQELIAINNDRRDDNPVSLNRKDDTQLPVFNILEKNYSTAVNEDIFGNNNLNSIMLRLSEETNARDSNERNDVHFKYMSDNNKSDCNLKDPEYSNILGAIDRKNDSLVADVQVNFENPEKEAIVPSYNRFQNEGTASNIHKEKSKVCDENITLNEVRNRKSVVSDVYSDTQMSGMSLFHEVSESAAALLVDEQHNGTWRARGIVTSPSMCAERKRPKVSIISLNDSQKTGFTTITNQMGNLAYTPSRVKISEKRKIYGEDKCYEYKKPKVELFTKQQIEEVCYKSHQMQQEIIKQKLKTVIKPEAGLLFIKKQERDRLSLNKVEGLRPKIYTEEQLLTFGLKKEVICISARNSSLFQFDGKDYSEEDIDFYSKGLQVGQQSYLLFKSDSKAGLTEIRQCFLASPGVDPKLVPDEWVANHYRWIVWKLASMEKSFPEIFGGRCLNPENILQQLKYRYDREIDRTQRSAFKKISEGDESASRLFICCVAAVRNNDTEIDESTYDLELTDGWYSLWASVDQEMVSLINKGKVCVGSKLAIMGAESINPDQICDPLKVVKECRLKVCTNSCRRARWDAKMGFVNSRCLSCVQLSSVLPHGGVVGKTRAVVFRVYPPLHMSKDSEGKTVFRNERTQSVEEARYEKIYNEKAEELYEQVWREVEQKYKKNVDVGMYSSKDIKTLTQPDVLWNLIEQTCDPATQGLLSNDQLKLVADYREQISSKMRQEVQDLIKVKMRDILPERHIVKLLKVRLVDCEKEIQALLTIWRPTEEICSIIKENKIISFTNVYASGTRERVLQLTNTRQTRYQEVSSFASNKFLRRVTCLSELKPVGITRPIGFLSSEIDVVGIVIYIKHPDHPKGLTIVYLTNLEGEYLAISFWTALKVFGCEDILTEDSLVCCYNLQWRTGSGAWRIPNVFATELSVFTQYPKLSHLKLEFSKIKSLLSFEKTTDRIAEHKLQLLRMLKKREYSSVGSSLSGGQMEYVSTSENQADITPVQKKIRKLSNYGRPSPLAPLPLFSRSPEVLQDFRSPCRVRGSPLSLSESDKS